jgi:hypothetical protein
VNDEEIDRWRQRQAEAARAEKGSSALLFHLAKLKDVEKKGK